MHAEGAVERLDCTVKGRSPATRLGPAPEARWHYTWGEMGMRDRAVRMALVAALVAAACAASGDGFRPEPYLADLATLERVTATTYANFEWAITEGGVDPAALHAETRGAILAAASDEEARAALTGFVERFRDGHFRLQPPAAETKDENDATPPGPETAAAEACAELGYAEHDQSFRIDFGAAFEFLTAPDDPFPAGILLRADGARIGVLRIDEFGPGRFGEYCPESWESFREKLEGPCAKWECRYRFRLTVVERLLGEIATRIGLLRAAETDALLVDITGNGGGTDWVDPAARLLTAIPLLGNELSVVRHPHWRGILEEMAGEVSADLAREGLSSAQREVLEAVRARLASGMEQAASPCDLSSVWQEGAGELPCTLLVRGALFTTGLTREPPGIEVEELTIGTSLFKSLGYPALPPAWSGPLAVLVDRRTASASELFTALLRDNDAALVIGEPTAAVGCGYTNGGIQTRLELSGLEIWLPDCARHRRDGGNERAGITPDLAVYWSPGVSAARRGETFAAALEAWELPGAP